MLLGSIVVSSCGSGTEGADAPPSSFVAVHPGDDMVDTIPAVDIGAGTTGLRGAIAAGVLEGDPANPYAGLRRLDGEIVIDETWLAEHNGGSRVVENFDLTGSLVIATSDVTVRHCRIRAALPALYAVQNNRENLDGGGFLLAWCEISFANPGGKVVLGRDMTLYRNDISGGEDGVHVNHDGATSGPVHIEQNYIHGQLRPEGHHSDGIQFNGDPGGLVVVRGNKVINHLKDDNAPVMLSGLDEITIEDNYLWGGVYFMVGGVDGTLTSRHNQFGWDSTKFGAYGVSEGEVVIDDDTWAEWIDPEHIDKQGYEIEAPTMPSPAGQVGTVVPPSYPPS
ncbi:MAG: hypothetical protein R2695_05190 [Acidimicrobiales bacterium]